MRLKKIFVTLLASRVVCNHFSKYILCNIKPIGNPIINNLSDSQLVK